MEPGALGNEAAGNGQLAVIHPQGPFPGDGHRTAGNLPEEIFVNGDGGAGTVVHSRHAGSHNHGGLAVGGHQNIGILLFQMDGAAQQGQHAVGFTPHRHIGIRSAFQGSSTVQNGGLAPFPQVKGKIRAVHCQLSAVHEEGAVFRDKKLPSCQTGRIVQDQTAGHDLHHAAGGIAGAYGDACIIGDGQIGIVCHKGAPGAAAAGIHRQAARPGDGDAGVLSRFTGGKGGGRLSLRLQILSVVVNGGISLENDGQGASENMHHSQRSIVQCEGLGFFVVAHALRHGLDGMVFLHHGHIVNQDGGPAFFCCKNSGRQQGSEQGNDEQQGCQSFSHRRFLLFSAGMGKIGICRFFRILPIIDYIMPQRKLFVK